MIYIAYWRHNEERISHHGFVIANSRDEAYDIVMSKLQKGYQVTHIYNASENQITPQSLTINFPNTTDYHLF
jgi:hypothetical protein